MSDFSNITNPYIGMDSYTEDYAYYFCGREKWQQLIIDNLKTSSITIFHGKSGVGKSSLLKAGVSSKLHVEAEENKKKKEGMPGMPKLAVVVFDNWSKSNPLDNIRTSIENSVKKVLDKELEELKSDVNELMKTWGKSEKTINASPRANLFQTWKAYAELVSGEYWGGKLLIILDQFEEYFLNQPEKDENKEFEQELFYAVYHSNLDVNFLISIRSEELFKLKLFEGYIPEILDNCIELKYLDRDSAEEAITEPIARYNKLHPKTVYQIGEDKKETKTVVDIILDQVELLKNQQDNTQSNSTDNKKSIETSCLQVLMKRFFDEAEEKNGKRILSLKVLKKLGNGYCEKAAEEVIKEYLNEQIKDLSSRDKKITTFILYHLVTPSGVTLSLTANDLLSYKKEIPICYFNLEENELSQLLSKLSQEPYRILQVHKNKRYTFRQTALIRAIEHWRKQYLQLARDITIEKGLPAQSLRQLRRGRHDLAALLALKAYEFNQQDQLGIQDEVDEALRESLSVDYFSQIFRGDKNVEHKDSISTVAFNPKDNSMIASGSHDGTIILWTLNSGNTKKNLIDTHTKGITSIDFSPDGNFLASGSWEEKPTLQLWNINNPKDDGKSSPPFPQNVTAVVFSKEILACSSLNGSLQLWHLDENFSWDWDYIYQKFDLNKHIDLKEPNDNGVTALTLSSKSYWLAAGYEDGTIKIWELEQILSNRTQTPKLYKNLEKKHDAKVKSLAFNSDSNLLASGSDDRKIFLWELDKVSDNSYEPLDLAKLKNEDLDKINSLAFYPKQNILASGGEDQKVRLWELDLKETQNCSWMTVKAVKTLPGQYFGISSVAFSSDGNDSDGNDSDGNDSDGNYLVTGSWNRIVRLWDLQYPPVGKPQVLKPYKEEKKSLPLTLEHDKDLTHKDNVIFVAVSPDGNMIASASWDHRVGLWKRESSDKEFEFFKFLDSENGGHKERVWSVAFSPKRQDGKKLLASTGVQEDNTLMNLPNVEKDNRVLLWNLENNNLKRIVLKNQKRGEEQKGGVSSVAFSKDADILAAGIWDDSDEGFDHDKLFLWYISKIDFDQEKYIPKAINLESLISKQNRHKWSIASVVFHPNDNHILATAGNDGIIRLWKLDEKDWKEGKVKCLLLRGHKTKDKKYKNTTIMSLAFSKYGKFLASGSQDKTIRLWDVSELDWEGIHEPKSIVVKDYHSENSHSSWVGSVAFNKDSQGNLQLASAGYEGTIKLWNLENISEDDWKNGKIRRKPISLRDHEQSVTSVAFIPNNPNNSNSPYKLVSGSYDNTVRLWITSTDKLAKMVKEKVLRSLTDDERERFEIPKRDEQ